MKTKLAVLALALATPASAVFAAGFDISSVVRMVDGKCVQNGVVLQPDACRDAYSGEVKVPAKLKEKLTQGAASPAKAITGSRYLAGSTLDASALKNQLREAANSLTQGGAVRVAAQTPEGKAPTTSIEAGGVALGNSYAEYKANFDAWKAGLSTTDRIRLSHQQAGYGDYRISSEKVWQEQKSFEASGKTGWEQMDDAYKARAAAKPAEKAQSSAGASFGTKTAAPQTTGVEASTAATAATKNTITHGVHVGADGTRYSKVCTTSSCILSTEASAKKLEIAQQLPAQQTKVGKTYDQYKNDHGAWQASMTQDQKALASKGGAGIATPVNKEAFLRESHMESYLRGDVDTLTGTTNAASMPPTTQPVINPTTQTKSASTVTHGAHVGADGTKYSRVCTGSSCLLAKEDSAKRLEIAQQLPSQTTKAGKTYDQYKNDHGAWQASMTQDQKALASKGGAGIAAPVAKEQFLRESHMESYLRGM